MTRRDRQRFERELKLEAVRLANDSGKVVTEVVRGISESAFNYSTNGKRKWLSVANQPFLDTGMSEKIKTKIMMN